MKITFAKFLFFYFLFTANSLMAQTLIWKENQDKAKSIHKDIPAGKAMIVFESKLNLVFESSMEYLDSTKREGNLYYLAISQRTCLITIKHPQLKILTNIPFGQLPENSLPTVKPGEIKYFEVGTENKLILFDNTEREKSAGSSDNQMLYEKEALLILTTDPVDMQLEIGSSVKITEIKNQENRHLVYIKPVDQVIGLKEKKNGATIEINVSGMKVKDVKYYFVSLPDYLREKGNQPSTPEEFLALAYTNYIAGNSKDALNNLTEYIARSGDEYIEPYMMLYELMKRQKGNPETIRYFKEFYEKEKSVFSRFMLLFAEKDFDKIKTLTLENPEFLPAKLYSINNEIESYRKKMKSDFTSFRENECAFLKDAENMLQSLNEMEKHPSSKFFKKPETINNILSDDNKNFIKSWGTSRINEITQTIEFCISQNMSKTAIMNWVASNSSYRDCMMDIDTINKLYDKIKK